MAKKLYEESNISAIAGAIRGKNGSQSTYKVEDMASAVTAIPNSYASGDEGKVVYQGALVAQSSLNINSNGTYDTTLKNQVVVSISGEVLPSANGVSF